MPLADSPLVPSLINMARQGHLSQAAAHFEGLVQLFDQNGSLGSFLGLVGVTVPPPAPATSPAAIAGPAPAQPPAEAAAEPAAAPAHT